MNLTQTTIASVLIYLDPGTGSLVIQLVLGALLAVGLVVRIFWRKIKALFTGKKPETAEMTQDEDEPAE